MIKIISSCKIQLHLCESETRANIFSFKYDTMYNNNKKYSIHLPTYLSTHIHIKKIRKIFELNYKTIWKY